MKLTPTPPEHLGDGAYVTINNEHLIVTANHHDPLMASSAVYLELPAIRALIKYLKLNNSELFQ